ncbi:AAA-domain-containing protein [Periconia macrospinosa]|uniref:AAA-domain-containing protein n=1 Tax=Periconia macrospinosa TaxID=97972 RepID=A0A2V1ECH6_9PLEO|nr:AAA-domain-containing protein [Periconia macrospinosa]
MRANSTQKAYDEAFLACSTAVYFESQSNEAEALRSWKSALDQIYYHNAHRLPSNLRPTSETERALIESLRQLELQCKERVDLLETLKKSRQDAEKKNASSSQADPKAPTPPPHTTPLDSTDSNASTSWLGSGTIPPVAYSDLSRPPLPPRPSMVPRKSSGNNSVRTLIPGGIKKDSRTPSPEKKGRMLRTLRSGKESKSSSTTIPTSSRSQPPDAAKAATQAWVFKKNINASKLSKEPTNSQVAPQLAPQSSNRSSFEKTRTGGDGPKSPLEVNPTQPSPFVPPNTSSSPALQTAPLLEDKSDSDLPSKIVRRKELNPSSSWRGSLAADRSRNIRLGSSTLPSYRNEYPDTGINSRVAATASAAATRSWGDNTGKSTRVATSTQHEIPSSNNNQNNHTRKAKKALPLPVEIGADENEVKTRPSPRRKGKGKENTARADLSPTSSSDAENSEISDNESDEWKERVQGILKNLPRGVDGQAAQQILNDIVIQGDEVHWDDVAGLDIAKYALKETVVYPFLRPDLFMGLREPARGMLLFGPPGTGKTMLARAVATESKSTFFAISASSLTSKFLGESEKLVRALFALAKLLAPSIIFVDEIDSLLSSRSGSGEHEATRRIKTEFLIQWSDLAKAAAGREQTEKDKERGDASRVLVLAATNLPWAIDEAARRRFVRRQYIPLPEDHVRKSQVKTLLSHQKHELDDADLDRLVQLTDGFSGSDITALAKDAAMGPLRSLGEKLLHMTMDEIRPMRFEDFEASLQTIRPSVSKQGLKEYEDWAREFGERGG